MTDSQKKAIEELDSIMLKIGSAYCEDDKYEVTAQTLVELSFMVTHNKTLVKHSRNITLRQLLAYFNNQDPSDADQIQIVFRIPVQRAQDLIVLLHAPAEKLFLDGLQFIFRLIPERRDIFFDFLDFVGPNFFMLLGGLVTAVYVGWFLDKNVVHDQLTNGGKHSARFTHPYIIFCLRFIAPVAIIMIFLYYVGII